MKIKKTFAIIMLVVFSVTFVIGCGSSATTTASTGAQGNSAEPETIKIGVLYLLTGNNATSGNESVATLKVAADIVNEVHDINFPNAKTKGIQSMNGARIELITADTQASPEVSATEAERLITEEKVVALIGADMSSCTKTASAVAERYGVPFINGESSSNSLIGRDLDYFFHVGPVDSTLVDSTFDYMDLVKDDVGIKSVAIAGSDDDAGALFVDLANKGAEKRGYEVKTSFLYAFDPASLSAECLKLKQANADVLLIISSGTAPAILYVKTLKEMDINFKAIITARGGFVASEFFETVGEDANFIMTENAWAIDSVSNKDYVVKINDLVVKNVGVGMNGNYARAMQAFFVIIDALERAGTTEGEALKDALWATDMKESSMITTWEGCKFDENGQNIYAAGIMTQIQDGKYVTVLPEVSKAVIPMPKWSER